MKAALRTLLFSALLFTAGLASPTWVAASPAVTASKPAANRWLFGGVTRDIFLVLLPILVMGSVTGLLRQSRLDKDSKKLGHSMRGTRYSLLRTRTQA